MSALRRAELPFRRTQGFHPKPRLTFALSLPLGVVGREEVVELELDHVLAPEEVRSRLAAQAPPGLEVGSVRRIDLKVGAQVRSLSYGLAVPVERVSSVRELADGQTRVFPLASRVGLRVQQGTLLRRRDHSSDRGALNRRQPFSLAQSRARPAA